MVLVRRYRQNWAQREKGQHVIRQGTPSPPLEVDLRSDWEPGEGGSLSLPPEGPEDTSEDVLFVTFRTITCPEQACTGDTGRTTAPIGFLQRNIRVAFLR